jgi:hypothetical protein
MNFFDAYELRTRIIPSLIVISPYLLLISGFAPTIFSNIITSSAGMVIFLALLYLFSFVISFCIKETRIVNPYRRLTFHQEEIPLRHIAPGDRSSSGARPDQGNCRNPCLVEKHHGPERHLPLQGIPSSSLLNFTTVHFSTFANTAILLA